MIHHSEKEIVDYKFSDFTEEFGDFYDEEVRGSVTDMPGVTFSSDSNGDIFETETVEEIRPLTGESFEGMPKVGNPPEIPEETELPASSRSSVHSETLLQSAHLQAGQILLEAQKEAEQLLSEASKAAAQLRTSTQEQMETLRLQAEKTGYDEGFEKGKSDGTEAAYTEARRELDEKNRALLNEISQIMTDMKGLKKEYIERYHEDMKELVITIAEKIIHISLRSSSEVIRRMILSAIEERGKQEWVRIYLSECDVNLMKHEDADILAEIGEISDHIRIVPMENGNAGDLMVEFPDGAVDAGVGTQLENVRQLFHEESEQ